VNSRIIEISVPPIVASSDTMLKNHLISKRKLNAGSLEDYRIIKRSIDARKHPVKVNLRIEIGLSKNLGAKELDCIQLHPPVNVFSQESVYIVGCGPAGLFAALKLIQLNKKPVIIERGKKVRERRRDIAALTKDHEVNPESNYCFGEGGAGTFSDGKLYTRSKKRGDVQNILNTFIRFGADENIGIDAHPHIGTNKLPQIIEAMRNYIAECGGEIHFGTKLLDVIIEGNVLKGIETTSHGIIETDKVILATGHSARDIYRILSKKKVKLEFKPFALGVRVEHPQALIDSIQYKMNDRGEYLPAASYSLVRQVNKKGVFSFCMCPGGIIAPCATEKDEVVTNGWSPSKRNMKTANSGIVVEVNEKDINVEYALSGIDFQKIIENDCWVKGGKTQRVPAQRLTDFLNGKVSTRLPESSYLPGTTSVDLATTFPSFILDTLMGGFRAFSKSLHGFLTEEAIIHAPESRTSSPVRIPRDHKTLEHVQIKGLYPCGEGAGYAGGIMSAALDGEKCATACVTSLENS